jgi:hypothetical protein
MLTAEYTSKPLWRGLPPYELRICSCKAGIVEHFVCLHLQTLTTASPKQLYRAPDRDPLGAPVRLLNSE